MRASVAAAWPAVCSAFEGRCWWMYLDTKRKVTTGIGFLIDSKDAALRLPWRKLDGSLATPVDIAVEWQRVKKLTRLAPSGGYAYRASARLRLPEADIDRLLMDMTASWWTAMWAQWPGLESWPADAQLAYLDEAWQNGKYFTANWPDTRAGMKAQDFRKVAGAVPGSGPRADFRKRLFRNAAIVIEKGIDRDILWNTKVPVANVVPKDPPVIVPDPGPIAQPGVRSKPSHGSRTEKVWVDPYGNIIPKRVDSTSCLISTRQRYMWLEQVYLYHQAGGKTKPYLTQGGWSDFGPSAGTHGEDANDSSTKAMSRKERQIWEAAGWAVGFAGWLRNKIIGLWPDHWHALPKGGQLSPAADRQVINFRNAQTGLVGNGAYSRIARQGVQTWTWEDYLAGWGVSLSKLQDALEDGKVREDVKDLQWALTRHLGTDVVGDGQLGPQTKAALAKVGPLTVETLTTLGLVVLP
jgi:hypothetical protein